MPMHSIGVYLYSMNKTCSICRCERSNTEILTLLCSVVETDLGKSPVPGDPLSQVGCQILLFLFLELLVYPCQSCVHCQWDIVMLRTLVCALDTSDISDTSSPVTTRVLFQIPDVFHNAPFGWAYCSYESVLGSLPSLEMWKSSCLWLIKMSKKQNVECVVIYWYLQLDRTPAVSREGASMLPIQETQQVPSRFPFYILLLCSTWLKTDTGIQTFLHIDFFHYCSSICQTQDHFRWKGIEALTQYTLGESL